MMDLFQGGCPSIAPPVVGVALTLCLGGIASYIPQYVALVRAGRADGVSEKSLFALICSQAALVLNSLILNWSAWSCYTESECGWWSCTTGLLSFFQITVNMLAAIPVWIIFLRFKIRDSQRTCIYDLGFALVFCVLVIVALVLSLVEKSQHNLAFFDPFAHVLGGCSAALGVYVWIPQTWKLIRHRNTTGLSIWMFILQSVGGVIIVLFQAVLYHQSWTTWIGYVFVCVEQIGIVVILIVFKVRGIGSNELLTLNLIPEEEEEELLQQPQPQQQHDGQQNIEE